MDQKFDNLKDLSNHLNEKGLPDTDSMRYNVNENRENELSKNLQSDLAEYKVLFKKWHDGDANDEETQRMTQLSKELEKAKSNIEKNS